MIGLKKLMEKKSDDKPMNPKKKQAKMAMLEQLRDVAKDMMMEDLKGGLESAKKVSVMSDSKEGLEKGLDKAKDLLSKTDMPEDEEYGSPDESDDIEAKIAELMKLKAAKKKD